MKNQIIILEGYRYWRRSQISTGGFLDVLAIFLTNH
jgi:hypothetical protein